LEAESWALVQTIAELLNISASTVHLHLTTSLNMKSRHFKWVPGFLDDDLRGKLNSTMASMLGESVNGQPIFSGMYSPASWVLTRSHLTFFRTIEAFVGAELGWP
jgi:hypothetical protein